MNVRVKQIGLTKIMFLEPKCFEEEKILKDFCHINTPLEVAIKHYQPGTGRHLEIRKET